MIAFVALVTGATSGIGLAIGRRLVSEGAQIIAAGRRTERLDALRRELGDSVFPWGVDVRDRQAVEDGLATLPESVRHIDVVVHSAGLALELAPAQSASLDAWQSMVETNIDGVLYVTRALLPGMIARGRGHVVMIGSTAGTYPYPGANVYGATKAFVAQFARNLRADLISTPVRVTNIEPGMVGGTEFSVVRFGGDANQAAAVYAATEPLTADDVADAVWWAISRPAHVNINAIELMPVCQAFGPLAVSRKTGS